MIIALSLMATLTLALFIAAMYLHMKLDTKKLDLSIMRQSRDYIRDELLIARQRNEALSASLRRMKQQNAEHVLDEILNDGAQTVSKFEIN